MAFLRKAAANRSIPWVLFSVALLLLVNFWVLPVDAQKKQAQPAAKSTDTFKELLMQHQGEKTSIGVLKKIGSDYIIVEKNESTTAIYPIEKIQALRMIKGEEGEPNTVEIALVAKD